MPFFTNRGITPLTVPAGPYAGPGDIVGTQATAWGGLRGYNAAYTGAAIDVVKTSDGTGGGTINILSDGSLDVATIAAFGYGVSVSKIYDQTGTGHHWTQATLANMPTVVLNAIGTKPALRFTAASSQRLDWTAGTGIVSSTLKFCMSAVAKGLTGSTGAILGDASTFCNFSLASTTNTLAVYAGTVLTVAAADNAFHGVQALFAGASSIARADATSASGNAGTAPVLGTAGLSFGCVSVSPFFDGYICEGGVWVNISSDVDISANFAALASQQQTYWGYP